MTARFDLFLPQMRMTHDAIVERALAAEAAGFRGMAFMDHLAPPGALDQDMWEAMSTAAWVLARTTALEVGHLVLCDSLRHPALLARQATSLDHASGGRFELGIGWGSVPAELETFGIGSTSPQDRVGRLGESLAILRGLWSGERVDHDGEHFTLVGAQQRPVPTRRIPITVGGVGPRTLSMARSHADWCNVPVTDIDRVDELRDQTGGARISIQPMVALLADEKDRREVTASVERRFGAQMRQSLVAGTVPEIVERFADWHSRGVERFYPWFADFAQVATLERFAEVITRLHERSEQAPHPARKSGT